MAARAIWKGVIQFGATELPVKQQLVSSESGEVVEYEDVKKAFPVSRGKLVVLDDEELEAIEPKPSRDIEITRFVAPDAIDHRWYERAYFLGPDGSKEKYFACAEALARKKKEGIARWVMRDREYVGALRADEGYLMLIVLRHADEVIASDMLEPPEGRALAKREVEMAAQLLAALEDEFDPSQYEDQYRKRVMELVETKARGGKVKMKAFKRPPKTDEDKLAKALEASLAGLGKKRARG